VWRALIKSFQVDDRVALSETLTRKGIQAMRRKFIWMIVASLMFAAGVGTVALLGFSSPHASDAALIRNFYEHEVDFNRLVKMAHEDLNVQIINSSFVGLKNKADRPPSSIYLHDNEAWPRSEAELGFTKQRWDEYGSLFQSLKLGSGMSRKYGMTDAIFFTASLEVSEIDDAETAITEKGYVYGPQGINNSLTGPLDGMKLNRPAIFYRKLNDSWYLYYEWSVSKPE
jgi:hypothetical protein